MKIKDYTMEEILEELMRRTNKDLIDKYESFIKSIGCLIYGKECLFKQEDGQWYNLDEEKYMDVDELLTWFINKISAYMEY